ncbi:glycosyltransferase family 2 protein [Aestuariibius insulae]|uniref:glycosyltransferase family 2 protein n=1 Tax=Aestuariibius insulae TaxID=2058287 RepID=UPI00345F0D6A
MRVCVGICTFQRDSLTTTLESVSNQKLPQGVKLSVVVADNDVEAVLSQDLARLARQLELELTYIHAPARNISISRNACLENASGGYLAFIDDDEIAEPNWIARLLDAARSTGAGVVFGPADAVYPASAPAWIRENDFHSNHPTTRDGVVETGYSSNALLDLRDPKVSETRFDLSFGRTGGEDIDFFFRLHQKGVRMVIADEARVREPVDPQRLSLKWLLRRKFAAGKIYGHCATASRSARQVPLRLRSAAKALYCGIRAVPSAPSRTRLAFWVMRSSFHFGVFFGTLSPPQREAYGVDTLK